MLGDSLSAVFQAGDRTALFIDGANLYGVMKVLNLTIDYMKFRALFAERSRLLRAYYYSAVDDQADVDPVRRLLDFLDNNHFTLVTKPIRHMGPIGEAGTIKGNMDIEIAVDMLSVAKFIDHLILVSGDGDFRYLIEALQKLGKRVTVVSTRKDGTGVLSRDLRRQADNFIDLDDVRGHISRDRIE